MQFTFGKIQIDLTEDEMKLVHDRYEELISDVHKNNDFESAKSAVNSLSDEDDYGDMLPWDNPEYDLYIDGFADKLNHGGWRVELKDEKGETISSDYDIDKDTSLGRMKLSALIHGFSLIPENVRAKIHFNYRPIIDVIGSGEIEKWANEGWVRDGAPIKNLDLWKKLYDILKDKKTPLFQFVQEDDEETKCIMENIKTLIILDIKRIAA